jgi:hypothetical protein
MGSPLQPHCHYASRERKVQNTALPTTISLPDVPSMFFQLLVSTPPLPDIVSPSTTQNWDVYDYGPVFMEEEFPSTMFHPMEDPTMAPSVNVQNPLVPPIQGNERLSRTKDWRSIVVALFLKRWHHVSVEEESRSIPS